MPDERREIHIEDEEVRAGRTTGAMRWVLGISLLLAIVAMSVVWILPAMSQGDAEGEELASSRVEEMREDGTSDEEIPAIPDPMKDEPAAD